MTTSSARRPCLEVIRRQTDYAIHSPEGVLRTPDGLEMAHPDPRPLEYVVRELTFAARDEACIPPVRIFSALCRPEPDDGFDKEWFRSRFSSDPVVVRKDKPASGAAIDSLDLSDPQTATAVNALANLVICLNQFLIEATQGGGGWVEQAVDDLRASVEPQFLGFVPERRAGVRLLAESHEAGVLVPLLLLAGRITASEYAAFVLSLEMTGARALAESEGPGDRFRRLRADAAAILELLQCLGPASQADGVRELIAAGESYSLEFKSSLAWNVKAGRRDAAIEHAALKTLAAFLNSAGGTLVLGVRDDGSAEGIEVDGFPNRDRFALHFWNLVKSSMGQDICHFLRGTFDQLDGKTVFLVHCSAATRPVFLAQKGFDEEFFIRVGPSSSRLSIQEALQYIAHRFRS